MSYPKDIDEYEDVDLLNELATRSERRYYGRCDYCNRFRDDGKSCRFPRRHMLAVTKAESKKPVETVNE